jgi:hypothetical protein
MVVVKGRRFAGWVRLNAHGVMTLGVTLKELTKNVRKSNNEDF